MLVYSNIINVGLTYLRGLEIAEFKEADMPSILQLVLKTIIQCL